MIVRSMSSPSVKHSTEGEFWSHVHDAWLSCRAAYPRLALSTVLRGDPRGFWRHFGIKCGSWSQMSQGTSGKSICTALGNQDHAFVRDGNCMASRML